MLYLINRENGAVGICVLKGAWSSNCTKDILSKMSSPALTRGNTKYVLKLPGDGNRGNGERCWLESMDSLKILLSVF